MTSPGSTPWPPTAGPTTIVVPRESAVLTAAYNIQIAAPAHLVFRILRETSDYPKWNTFVPRVTINRQPEGASAATILASGTAFTYHVVMNPVQPNSVSDTMLAVTDISTPDAPSEYVPASLLADDGTFTSDLSTVYRISWREGSGWISRGLRVERFHEVIVRGNNACEVRTWELQASVLAHVVKILYGSTIQARFEDWCEGLKRYSEEQAKSSGG